MFVTEGTNQNGMLYILLVDNASRQLVDLVQLTAPD